MTERPDAAPPKEEPTVRLSQLVDELKDLAPTEEPPTLRSLVGSVPDLTNGVESVEYIRKKREELASPKEPTCQSDMASSLRS